MSAHVLVGREATASPMVTEAVAASTEKGQSEARGRNRYRRPPERLSRTHQRTPDDREAQGKAGKAGEGHDPQRREHLEALHDFPLR